MQLCLLCKLRAYDLTMNLKTKKCSHFSQAVFLIIGLATVYNCFIKYCSSIMNDSITIWHAFCIAEGFAKGLVCG